jgi:hypothetical protein
MKKIFLVGLLAIRLITNEGVFNEGRRPQPKRQFQQKSSGSSDDQQKEVGKKHGSIIE